MKDELHYKEEEDLAVLEVDGNQKSRYLNLECVDFKHYLLMCFNKACLRCGDALLV